jgi:predicted RNA binding protein YcfA (HicA-like mRNA interferase family)
LRLRTKSCRVWVADSSDWLSCGIGKLCCSPRLTGEGSCAILSPRPVTRSHAPVRLFVPVYGKIKPFYPLRGVPCLFRLFPTSHPNTDLDGHDNDFRGYIDGRIRDSTAGYAPPHPEGWGIRYPCTPTELKKAGFVLYRQARGSHEIWYNPVTKRRTTIPNHPVLIFRKGLLRPYLRKRTFH